jgi:hypothetical protein
MAFRTVSVGITYCHQACHAHLPILEDLSQECVLSLGIAELVQQLRFSKQT